ncbi:Arc family DNA-binding protein [Komagataeibacter sp. FNDCR1]|nr:Arc family DNA-binding protein [Komagataeibacter sp. FNDCR1]
MSDSSTRSITVRLDASILQSIREAAAKNSRSMNAEIAERLAESIRHPESKDGNPIAPDEVEERVKMLRREMAFIDFDRSSLTEILPKSPKSVQGLIIQKLAELDRRFTTLSDELRRLDPNYLYG